jgi:anti-sigma regulatory factor (Ser/Thr protein kinase)
MAMASTAKASAQRGFRHEALLHRGIAGFLEGTVPYLRDGLEAGEPMLVVVRAAHIAALRSAMGTDADGIHFADMAVAGHNPARIIPAWRDFLDEHGGGTRPVRGVGEPIWADRPVDELVESQRHEMLLNVAFAESGRWTLLCPYDLDALPAEVIEEAERSHPYVIEGGEHRASSACLALDDMAGPFDVDLPPAPIDARPYVFRRPDSLAGLRMLVTQLALRAGFDRETAGALVLAAKEAATNCLRHGGGEGILRMWRDHDTLVCELRDTGHLADPLAGRVRPDHDQCGGRGLWMANQLCDLVQLRTTAAGNVARLHLRIPSD